MKYASVLASVILCLVSQSSLAGPRAGSSSGRSKVTYDLGGGSGSYNGETYTEITLGLNWNVEDWLNWRNAAFTRGGAGGSVNGLDSSLRLQGKVASEGGGFGVDGFIGPGVRLATNDNTAVFGEAGLLFTLGGLRIGGGAKALTYIQNRTDAATGVDLPKSDTQLFIILGGGGSF